MLYDKYSIISWTKNFFTKKLLTFFRQKYDLYGSVNFLEKVKLVGLLILASLLFFLILPETYGEFNSESEYISLSKKIPTSYWNIYKKKWTLVFDFTQILTKCKI